MIKTRVKELFRLALSPGVVDVREITVREASIGLGWGFLVLGLGLLQLFLGVWQCLVGFLLFGYDLIGKGLNRIMLRDLPPKGEYEQR